MGEKERLYRAGIELRKAQLALATLHIPLRYWGSKHGRRLPFDTEEHDAAEHRLAAAVSDFGHIADAAIARERGGGQE